MSLTEYIPIKDTNIRVTEMLEAKIKESKENDSNIASLEKQLIRAKLRQKKLTEERVELEEEKSKSDTDLTTFSISNNVSLCEALRRKALSDNNLEDFLTEKTRLEKDYANFYDGFREFIEKSETNQGWGIKYNTQGNKKHQAEEYMDHAKKELDTHIQPEWEEDEPYCCHNDKYPEWEYNIDHKLFYHSSDTEKVNGVDFEGLLRKEVEIAEKVVSENSI